MFDFIRQENLPCTVTTEIEENNKYFYLINAKMCIDRRRLHAYTSNDRSPLSYSADNSDKSASISRGPLRLERRGRGQPLSDTAAAAFSRFQRGALVLLNILMLD